MAKFRRKLTTVEAVQWLVPEHIDHRCVTGVWRSRSDRNEFFVNVRTELGVQLDSVRAGDWIINPDASGACEAVVPDDIFRRDFELVDDAAGKAGP